MYKIKQIPEDFVVKEVIKPKLDKSGNYTYFWMKKRDWTTMSAVQAIANSLHRPLKDFGWAGNKDKRAITEQMVSARNVNDNSLKNLKIKDIEIKIVGKGSGPISLGANIGNKFDIVARDISGFKKPNKVSIPNYFDEQRFSGNNADIGKAMIKRDFAKALELVLKSKSRYDVEMTTQLEKNPKDFIGALKKIPKRLLLFYIHAYQSKLFNETVKKHLKGTKKLKNIKLPIIGFGTAPDSLVRPILAAERLSPRDFILKEIPEISSEGGQRDLMIKVKSLRFGKLEDDDLNKDKKKLKVSFEIPKGCYATIVIKAFFSAP